MVSESSQNRKSDQDSRAFYHIRYCYSQPVLYIYLQVADVILCMRKLFPLWSSLPPKNQRQQNNSLPFSFCFRLFTYMLIQSIVVCRDRYKMLKYGNYSGVYSYSIIVRLHEDDLHCQKENLFSPRLSAQPNGRLPHTPLRLPGCL
jgi:hypothetical protein